VSLSPPSLSTSFPPAHQRRRKGPGRCRSLPRRRPWARKISMPKTKTRLWCVPVEKTEVRVSVRTRCTATGSLNCNRKNGRRLHLPCVGQPAGVILPATIISRHPELSLLASLEALSNSSLPHNPPRSGRQSQGCGSHVSYLLFVDSPAGRNLRTGIRTSGQSL
jgi:hypothetical protein